MLKRLAIIAFFTGFGQLFSVFALKYVSKYAFPINLKAVGEVDSTMLLVMNIIALGLQSAAMRDLTLAEDWKKEYGQLQSARLCLSILLMAFAVFALFNKFYIFFIFSPVFALNSDYVLYARGYSITGSLIACIRLLIPFSAIAVMVHYNQQALSWIYMGAIVVIYFITNLFMSAYLRTPQFFFPRFRNLHLYVKSLSLGVMVLSLYFIGLGLMLVVPYFYSNNIIPVVFLGLKFYVLFKGVLRIIHQAFMKDMVSYDVCFKVDQLTSLIGLSFCCFMIFFPETFIRLFFGEKYLVDKTYFILLAIAALIYSSFASLTIKAMLEKKDWHYAGASSFAALITITLSIVFSFFWQHAFAISLSLVIGETVFACCMIIIMKQRFILPERLLFLTKNLFYVLIPAALAFLFGDTPLSFAIALSVFGLSIAVMHYKKFSLPLNG